MEARRRAAALAWRYGRVARWVLAGLCLVAAALTTGPPDELPQQVLTVAARAIPSGVTLDDQDLVTVTATLPVATPTPADLVGEVTRGPLEPGEPVTAGRIVPGGQIDPPPGSVVFPLTLADERIAALLQSGDRVDVLVTPDALHEGQPRVVATDIEVLAVPVSEGSGFGPASPQSGSVVLLGLPQAAAPDLAAIRRSDHVTVAIR